jgi:hypothetical protein
MTTIDEVDELLWLREDLAYHQARVLMLTTIVAATPGHQRKLDGLTKLAKLDFLLRYPALAPVVLDTVSAADDRLHLTDRQQNDPTDVEAPMIRYKYGPWDDRYYPVIGALVARGLLRYAAGKRGSVALVPTPAGRELVETLADSADWSEVADRVRAVAEGAAGLNGTQLKDLIYQRLAELMDRPQRQVIR